VAGGRAPRGGVADGTSMGSAGRSVGGVGAQGGGKGVVGACSSGEGAASGPVQRRLRITASGKIGGGKRKKRFEVAEVAEVAVGGGVHW